MSIELERGSGIEQSKNLLIKNFEGPAMFLGEHQETCHLLFCTRTSSCKLV